MKSGGSAAKSDSTHSPPRMMATRTPAARAARTSARLSPTKSTAPASSCHSASTRRTPSVPGFMVFTSSRLTTGMSHASRPKRCNASASALRPTLLTMPTRKPAVAKRCSNAFAPGRGDQRVKASASQRS